ncbi:hypothetical protein niasHT_009046 [Heterodera trifolii]|uniref:G-protein coupled receptors family 1 profile domain-containing protein n=1 Tax=Heterodera trifolii TaxID=157864 RepID=A0ABD2M571_9BILA
MSNFHHFLSCCSIIIVLLIGVSTDFSLMCNHGYRVTSIRRVNSAHQRKGTVLGSFAIECQPIVSSGKANLKVKCSALETTPQCNGWAEGCSDQQWLGGFNAYVMDNRTNAILLDPICCESPQVIVDQLSCATERLNLALMPFEHTIATDDFIYRGIHCWHQYNQSGTPVDFVWKMEICQFRVNGIATTGLAASSSSPSSYRSCPPCVCHCGINVCGNGFEPVRVTHKIMGPNHGEDCNATSNCHASRWLEESSQNLFDNTLIGLSLISIVANILVIICARRLFVYNRDTIHIYIASMTFGDLVVVFCQIFESFESRRPFLGVVPCICVYLLGWSGIAVSALSLVLLNGDKLLFFNFPIYYRVIKSVRRALRMCAMIWTVSLGVPTCFWLFGILRIRDPNKCEMTVNFEFAPGMEYFYTILITLFCICPIFSSAVVSCYLLRLMRTKRQFLNKMRKNFNNSTAANSAAVSELCQQAPAFSNKLRSLVFIFTTTVWTALSLLPFRLLMLYWMYLVDIDHFCAEKCQWLQWIYNFAWAFLCLLKLNPARKSIGYLI